MTESERWSPWWATVLAIVALAPPLVLLNFGLNKLTVGQSGTYMHELALAVAPFIIIAALIAMIPAALYLALRRKFLFVLAIVIALGLCVLPLL